MQVLAVQFDIVWEDPPANCAKVRAMIEDARPSPGSLIILPEMFATGFTMDVSAATRQHERTIQFLCDIAREHSSYVVGGVATPAPVDRARNQAIVVDPSGQVISAYTKIHPFTLGGERDHFEAGSEIVTFECNGFTVAPFVCYDLRFPEIFRLAVRRLANLFIVIANWPTSRVEHWTMLLRARAIENQAYVVGVNRCGMDPNLAYPGRSMLVDPMGSVLIDAGPGECVIRHEARLNAIKSARERFPFLKDLRNEFLPR
jgi:omega-amidase